MSQLTSVAFRTHEHAAMRAFYAEAFGVSFRVISIARKHGGAVQDAATQHDGRTLASIRDPDGNTIELYSRSIETASP